MDIRSDVYKRHEHTRAIDGLRGVIAIIIALFHFELLFPIYGEGIFKTGYLGVEVFLILSGFLLAKGAYKKYEKKTIEVSQVVKKKIARLYPEYIVALLLLIILYSSKWFNWNLISWFNSEPIHKLDFLTEILCIQTTGYNNFSYINGPDWYVSALLISTVILVALIKYIPKLYMRKISFIISITFYVLLFNYNMYMDPNSFLIYYIPTALIRSTAGMCLGIASYFLYEKVNLKLKSLSFITVSMIEITMFIFLLLLLSFREPSKLNYLIFIPSCSLILIMFSTSGILSKILSLKPIAWLGSLSYSFYLMQSFCSNFVNFNKLNEKQPYITLYYLFVNLLSAIILFYSVQAVRKFFIKCKK
ncbi:acyltransferase [Clostridium botulinum]|nr:acyltransferase [Clostridium botulinum]